MRFSTIAITVLTLLPAVTGAEVTDSAANGFTSEHTLLLEASPERAYEALTRDIHLWWDASHSFGGDAAAFTLDTRAGGCFCEALAEGGAVEHMRVVNAQPGKTLTLHGGLGPLQGVAAAGAMTFSFEPHPEGTTLSYRYVVGGYMSGGLDGWAGPVDQVQLGQLKRLQAFIASGEALN